jgi:ubiquinone/menaquinone biosynthesis C-methylase UbiE
MSCHGGFSLDENTRRSWYNPEGILKEINLQPNMTFIDIGSGNGFFTLLAAKEVGKQGFVYAVDSDEGAIKKLKEEAKKKGLENVKASVGLAEESAFCKSCADVVFFSMVLHDFKDPIKVLQNSKKMLKPSGILVNLDWKKKETSQGPPFRIRFSEKDVDRLLTTAKFKVNKTRSVGPSHYLITATPKV